MADGRGRPRLGIGQLGNVSYSESAHGVIASSYTRTAGGERKRVQASGPTEREALTVLMAKAAQLGVLAPTTAEVATLGALLDRWVEDIADTRNVTDQTRRMYRTKVNRLKGFFGGVALVDLRRARVQVILNSLAQKVTAGEYRTLTGVLNRAMNYGVMLEVLDANHVGATEAPSLKMTDYPVSLTAAQLKVLLDEFQVYVDAGVRESNRHKALLATRLIVGLGGLRLGEALAIRRRDVDLDAGTVDVNGTVIYKPGIPIFRQNQPKSRPTETRTRAQSGRLGYGRLARRNH